MCPATTLVNGKSRSALPAETELKLSLPAAQARQLWKTPPLSALLINRPSRLRLFSAYYDTPTLDLRQRGVALRLRRQGKRWVQTLKTDGAPGGGLQQRTELEVALPNGVLDQQWLKRSGLTDLSDDVVSANALGVVFTTDFHRVVATVEPVTGTSIEICVDQGVIVAGTKRQPICEVELELKQGRLGPLFDLAEQLATVPDTRIATASKAQRGYRMVARERPAPTKARIPELPIKADIDTIFQTLAFACIAQMQSNEQGVLHSRDIEYLHQTRVALRRLRSVLSVVSRTVPTSYFRAHRAWLRETSQILGDARDWDVFMTEFLSKAASDAQDYPALSDLKRYATRRRSDARRRVRTALASTDYTTHMLGLARSLHEKNWDAERSSEHRKIAALSPKKFAASVLERAHHKAVKRGKRLDPANYSEFHQLRIRIKKLRYSVELLCPLFGKKVTRKYLSRLADLQKVLGELNDAANAASRIDQLAMANDDATYAQAIAYLRGVADAQARFSLSGFNTVWKKFCAAAPFW